MHASSVKSSVTVSNVRSLNSFSSGQLLEAIKNGCGEADIEIQDDRKAWDVQGALGRAKKAVVIMKFEESKLSSLREIRDENLRDNDARIDNMLKTIISGREYTVIYTTTSSNTTIYSEHNGGSYQAEFADPAHMDLRRDLESRVPPNTHQKDMRPLFETYQFLTPGLFMGIIAGLIMLSILTVGIKAISGLQVSYAAFEKEMGPAAQRKGQ